MGFICFRLVHDDLDTVLRGRYALHLLPVV